ncbi:MAG: hypothetical protein NPIRA04_19110 [Nitrospirales bacterium]|nr:MAG: hypothetical protein NPIRA04_19110 [Nitrospirales bacterium]
MQGSSESILDQALKLPIHERAEVAEQLIQSLEAIPDIDVESAWQQEIQRRLSELETGATKTISWEEVKRRLTHGN